MAVCATMGGNSRTTVLRLGFEDAGRGLVGRGGAMGFVFGVQGDGAGEQPGPGTGGC